MLLKFSVKLSDKGGKISASRYGRVLVILIWEYIVLRCFLEYDLKEKQIKHFWTLASKIVA